MLKLIAIGAVLFLVYLLFFKKTRINNKDENNKYDEISDTLVECPTCKVYVSKDEAILSNGKYYCSKKCLK
jgi:uncharacterized protein